jgi:PAS domain S-box-containing protein
MPVLGTNQEQTLQEEELKSRRPERRQADEVLHYSEARYRALFLDNPTMIVTLDTELAILSANPSCVNQLGYTIDELEGQSVLMLFHEDDRANVAEHLQRCLKEPDQAHHWQFRKVRKDGAVLWVEETAQAVYNLTGALNVLVVCQDVTDQKRVEETLRESEARFHAIFDLAAVGIAQVNLNGQWLLMNQTLADTLGYSFDELEKMTLQQISHPDDIDRDHARIRRLLAGKVPSYSVEKRYICKGGSILWVNLNVTLVRDKYGKPKYFIAIIENIDKRKKAQEAVHESEERFRIMADKAPVLIWMAGTDTLCTFFNKPWLDFTGRSFALEQGNGWVEGVHPEDMKRCQETYLTAFSAHQDFQMEYRLRRADGEYRWMVDAGVPRFMPNGEFVGYIGSCFDITERKYAEEEIKRLNTSLTERATELEFANKELEAFNYTVAHDLRQPLNIINGYCQAIEKLCGDQLLGDCLAYVREAYNGTLRMNRLIEALLNFSRLGHAEPRHETIDLSSIAQEVIGTLKQTEPDRQVDFQVSNDIKADCDCNLMRSVFENLLGNAWKYTGMREKAVIEFGVKDIDWVPTYYVCDNGAGFEMTDADKLFTPFLRLPGAEKQKGFGIGLATVERIIRRHGGKVWAEGELGKGACFYFTLSADEIPILK